MAVVQIMYGKNHEWSTYLKESLEDDSHCKSCTMKALDYPLFYSFSGAPTPDEFGSMVVCLR